MSNWFECKVKYQKIDASGRDKMVTEPYLIDAVSFTEAESRIHKELEAYISGEFFVTNIKIANYSEIIPDENGDRWFKCKVAFITLDEEKGVEKKSNSYMLVQANDVKEAFDNITKAFEDSVADYEIPAIQESPILDIFKFFSESDDNDNDNNSKPSENNEPEVESGETVYNADNEE